MQFDYCDPPAPEAIIRALQQLNYLAALDDEGNLTHLGSMMTEFPLDPQMSKLLISSPEFQCSNEILTIISMLLGRSLIILVEESNFSSVPNVFLRPPNARKEADAAKELLSIPEGNHLTLMNIYNSYISKRIYAWKAIMSKLERRSNRQNPVVLE